MIRLGLSPLKAHLFACNIEKKHSANVASITLKPLFTIYLNV